MIVNGKDSSCRGLTGRSHARGPVLKIIVLLLAVIIMMPSLTACGDDLYGDYGEEGSELLADSGSEESTDNKYVQAGVSMTVKQSSGEMEITRNAISGSAPMGEEDTWTIFIYMCGSDLESRLLWGGMASDDIKEMCRAASSKKVTFVVEAGGANLWHNLNIIGDPDERFVISNGKLKKITDAKRNEMGRSRTLSNFLKWGVKHYPADKMGVILWNHGGGSISGVCFDELHDDDSLSLRELDAAFLTVSKEMTEKFEFIGFDACLMGTLETANILASYAKYMYASQETEPGSGWDYTAIGNYLAEHPGAGGLKLGKAICKSYFENLESSGDSASATLSVIRLFKTDKLIKRFNKFAKAMYNASSNTQTLNSMSKKIASADNFGGNNRSEGYTNMVDLGGLIKACSKWADNSDQVLESLDEAVAYQVRGSDHAKTSGLSIYYPLSVNSSTELTTFSTICISPYYLSFVDRHDFGSVSSGDTEDYDDDTWFTDGFWYFIDLFLFDEDSDTYEFKYSDKSKDKHWEYVDDFKVTGESKLITFEEEPGMSEDGDFCFVLDEKGYENTESVSALVYEEVADDLLIELGETTDIYADWDNRTFMDAFDGYWLSLPDGQNLAIYPVGETEDYVIYSSPIKLNGEETFLRMRQMNDGSVTVEGVWDGIDESGAADRTIHELKKDDIIIPMYYCIDDKGNDIEDFTGLKYKIKDDLTIDYDLLLYGDYSYAFCIDDIFGDYLVTDAAGFNVDRKGRVSFFTE